jgi:hypothetical protein
MNNTISYWLDENNIIRRVDEGWDNNLDETTRSERTTSSGIIGKPLFEFICDDTTRMYMQALLQLIRVKPQTLLRPYRCDTPEHKRFLQMRISCDDQGWVQISHEFLKSELRAKRVLFKTVPSGQVPTSQQPDSKLAEEQTHSAENLENIFIRCSLCNRLHDVELGYWREIEDISLVADLEQPIPVRYGVCLKCLSGQSS